MSRIVGPALLPGTLPVLLALVLAGCGGGGGGHSHYHGEETLVTNPGRDLVGIWTGTFSDDFGDYTVSLEIVADRLIPITDVGRAEIVAGDESGGLGIRFGEIVELPGDDWYFEYETFDRATGNRVDIVTGEFTRLEAEYLEGEFTTSSGTSGIFSLAWPGGFFQDDVKGPYVMEFVDVDTGDLAYVGEVKFSASGHVIPGPDSYLTDDVSGPIGPGAGYWPIVGGEITLVDHETGYYVGELWFDDFDDTLFFDGYLGWDLGILAGLFDDPFVSGTFTFYPAGFCPLDKTLLPVHDR